MRAQFYSPMVQGVRINHADKKKDAPIYLLIKRNKKQFELFLEKSFLKIFKKSFILVQSQICISNGLEAIALQRVALFC